MGYKKDIFSSFAYEFDTLHKKMKSVQARMKSAMQMKSSATPQMKLNQPTAAAISSDRREDFIVKDDFTYP